MVTTHRVRGAVGKVLCLDDSHVRGDVHKNFLDEPPEKSPEAQKPAAPNFTSPRLGG